MATTKFIVKKSKANKEGKIPIYIQYCHESKTALFSTGERVHPNKWNFKNGKTRKIKDDEELESISDLIHQQRDEIDDLVRKIKFSKKNPTTDLVKTLYTEQKTIEKPSKNREKSFFELIEEFLDISKQTRAEGTLKGYRSALNHLKNFEKHRKTKIRFSKIDRSFYDRFCQYLFEELNMSSNTVGRYIKSLKVFLNYAEDQGISVNPAFHKFKVLQEDADIVYLSQEELQQLHDLDLSTNQRLAHVRDVFLFGCYTGLRYSDISQLGKEHIHPSSILLKTQKTRDRLKIPLIPQAKEILQRYEGKYLNALPVISNQKMNDYLKELGELAGLDTPVRIVRHHGSKKVEKSHPKYELLTTHTARRTFITLSLEKGVRQEVLMQITGHKDFKTLMRYVKIVDKVKEEEMLKAWG
ncbi:MAG: site-specific integrase [Bacteroidota bacterium]